MSRALLISSETSSLKSEKWKTTKKLGILPTNPLTLTIISIRNKKHSPNNLAITAVTNSKFKLNSILNWPCAGHSDSSSFSVNLTTPAWKTSSLLKPMRMESKKLTLSISSVKLVYFQGNFSKSWTTRSWPFQAPFLTLSTKSPKFLAFKLNSHSWDQHSLKTFLTWLDSSSQSKIWNNVNSTLFQAQTMIPWINWTKFTKKVLG